MRSTGVDSSALGRAYQGGSEVGQAVGVLGYQADAVCAERQEFVGEGHRRARSAAVDKAPFPPGRLRRTDHGQHRGDADAACDEEVVVREDEREPVARAPDANPLPRPERVHLGRPAPAVRYVEHADAVGLPVGGISAEGVRADLPGRQDEFDVRAGLPGGSGKPSAAASSTATTSSAADRSPRTTTGRASERAGRSVPGEGLVVPPLPGSVRRPASNR